MASSRYLTYPHPVYAHCALSLLIMIALLVLGLDVLVAICIGLFGGAGFLWGLIGVIPAFFSMPVIARYCGHLGQGKPPHSVKYRFQKCLGFNLPFVTYQGTWRTQL